MYQKPVLATPRSGTKSIIGCVRHFVNSFIAGAVCVENCAGGDGLWPGPGVGGEPCLRARSFMDGRAAKMMKKMKENGVSVGPLLVCWNDGRRPHLISACSAGGKFAGQRPADLKQVSAIGCGKKGRRRNALQPFQKCRVPRQLFPLGAVLLQAWVYEQSEECGVGRQHAGPEGTVCAGQRQRKENGRLWTV